MPHFMCNHFYLGTHVLHFRSSVKNQCFTGYFQTYFVEVLPGTGSASWGTHSINLSITHSLSTVTLMV